MRDKSVALLLGGVTRRLRLNMNSIAAFEDRTGSTISEMRDSLGRIRVSALRTLLWSLLITDDPEMTEEQVGAMVDFENLPEVSNAISEALRKAGSQPTGDSPPLPSTQPATAGAN